MAEKDVIPFTSETMTDTIAVQGFGTRLIELPEGDAICAESISLTSTTVANNETGEQFVVIIAVANHGGMHLGSISPMTPDLARGFAASLIDGANRIDGGARG